MNEIKVKNIIIGKQFENTENLKKLYDIVKTKKINLKVVEAGEIIDIEREIKFNVLWPNGEHKISERILNNNSLVCRLKYKKFSMLFTGDIEELAENEMISKYKDINILNSTALKVAHHGAKTSSKQEFLNLVKPEIALIGVEKNNNFGHPSSQIIERLKKCGTQVLRTDESGEITLTINRKGEYTIKKHVIKK